jgi:transposase InsO family protein
MSHRNAPLTPAGRLRLVLRCRTRPIAHVAAEAAVSRQCLSKWKARYDELGEIGLLDRPSVPHRSPTQLDAATVEQIATLRRVHKFTARQIHLELTRHGQSVSVATVGRWLVRLGLNRRADIDPDGNSNRTRRQITARYPGHMLHLDVKKVGRIPDGGGWRAHGRGSTQDRAARRAKTSGAKAGYVYLHSAVDGYSRLAYTEHLPDEKAATTIGFFRRAAAFFAAHGITRLVRVISDNGANYKATAFTHAVTAVASRHQRIRPHTPRHNGKVERYNRTLAEELLYARVWTSEAERAAAIEIWNIHYNYHRAHTATGDQPPASRLRTRVTNVTSQNIEDRTGDTQAEA